MKKGVSISLLGLLLYNAFGYYILFAYLHHDARIQYLEKLPDNAYEVLSYKFSDYNIRTHDTDFELVDKEVVLENKSYHIIKKRIEGNTLYLYFLPNHKQDELRQNLNNIVEIQTFTKQSSTDLPIKILLKSFLKYYITTDIALFFVLNNETVFEHHIKGNTTDCTVTPPYLPFQYPPPQVI